MKNKRNINQNDTQTFSKPKMLSSEKARAKIRQIEGTMPEGQMCKIGGTEKSGGEKI